MGKLFDLLQAASGEISLFSRFGNFLKEIAGDVEQNTEQIAQTNAAVQTFQAGDVPITRTLTAGAGLTGGGDLSANRTFAVDPTVLAAVAHLIEDEWPVVVHPLGTGADDWPHLFAVLNLYAGKKPVAMASGTWFCKSAPHKLPSDTILFGNPNVTIVSSLAFSGGAAVNCVFDTQRETNTLFTTLAAANTPGNADVLMNAAPAVGNIVGIRSLFGSQLRWAYYTVLTVGGVGPFTVILDRPVLNQYALNDDVYTVPSRPTGIYIYGNGMLITGTGDTALQFWQAEDCHVHDVTIDDSQGFLQDFSTAIDLGCNNCSMHNVKVLRSGRGIGMSSAEACLFENCTAGYTIAGLGAFDLFDCQECEVRNCEGYGAGAGILIASNGTNGGCSATRVTGNFWSNLHGVVVRAGSTNTVLDVSCRFNTTNGILVDNAGGATADIRVRGNVSNNALNINVDPTIVPGFTIEPRTLLTYGCGIVDPGGNTLSLYPGSAPDAVFGSGSIRATRVSKGVLRNLRASHAVAGANAGSSIAYTVFKNGAPTALTCSLDVTALSASDTDPTHAVPVAEGDKIAVLESNGALVASPVGVYASIEHSAF